MLLEWEILKARASLQDKELRIRLLLGRAKRRPLPLHLPLNYQHQKANINGSPMDLSLANGEQGILQDRYIGTLTGLQSQYAGNQAGLNAANTQQGLQQSGLTSAAGLISPVTGVPYGTQTINPATGQPMAGTGGDFTGAMQTYAQQLANNQSSSIPSSITGNPVLMAQLIQEAQKINPNFNYNTSQGIASGQQQVAATGGAIQSQQQTQIAQYTSSLQQGQNLQSQLADMIKAFDLNPTDINKANAGLQVIARNTSN